MREQQEFTASFAMATTKELTDVEMDEKKKEKSAEEGRAVKEASRDEVERTGYRFNEAQDKSLWFRMKFPLIGEIRFNPIVSLLAVILIWTFVIICSNYQKDMLPLFRMWRRWIVEKFTWLYIGSQDVWAIFAIVLYVSKYGNIKLGKDTDVPEYSDSTWFMMLFACGIGVGLFFYGVAEPLFHYVTPNRYNADSTMPDNTLAQIAINITLYHWGVHGWIVYSLVGLLLGLLAFRENMPMTMRSCFYPLIGDRIFGWIGDLIDVISIMTTLFGVCTSLGLGTKQLNTGLTLIFPDIPNDDTNVQVIIIWCITAVATMSTVSGVGMGIRRLSETCFLVGMFLMTVSVLLDNTFFIFNLYTQSMGYYFQYLIQLGFHTDAWEQLGHSYGAEDRGRFVPEGVQFADGPNNWMDSWTMFYWGWWISWCPFVGMFIAKISKGRTIRQFINGTLTAPVLYSCMWLVIFGGAGLRLERQSAEAGLCCQDDQGWFINSTEMKTTLEERGLNSSLPPVESAYFLCDTGSCGQCASSVIKAKVEENMTVQEFLNEFNSLGQDFGSSSADRSLARLSCHGTEQMWFDVMRSYGDVGNFLAGFSLIGIVLYFVTSSDSGSLVIDCLSANGDKDPPRVQRVFWALMEGATATALLVAGDKDGLTALQTAGLLSGLPYTFIVCLICTSIWRAVKVAAGDLDPRGPDFEIGLFDPFFAEPWENIWEKRSRCVELFVGFLTNLVMAPFTVWRVHRRLNNSAAQSWFVGAAAVVTFLLTIVFLIVEGAGVGGSWAIALFFYCTFSTIMTSVRMQTRDAFKINGNVPEDFFAALLLYPCCALQMDLTTADKSPEDKDSIEGTQKPPANGGVENVGYSIEAD